jgi:hypothetical protein
MFKSSECLRLGPGVRVEVGREEGEGEEGEASLVRGSKTKDNVSFGILSNIERNDN